MGEMVERVARAICRAGICGPRDHLDQQENANWRKFTLEARAAIEAMLDPTDEMLAAGSAAAEVCDDGWESNATWCAMVGAALAEDRQTAAPA